MIAGIGVENLRLIEVDENFAMRPGGAGAADRGGPERGADSLFCVRDGGDDFFERDGSRSRRLARSAAKHNLWLHVDAAMSGTAMLCPEFRHLQDGVEFADSYNFNPHKWMFTNFDCSCFWVADRKALIQTLSILPEYLRNQATESGAVIDYRDWHIQLGRRFRSLKLWFVIRHYGVEGLQHHVRRARAAGAAVRGLGAERRPLRTGRAGAAESGLLPPQGRGRGESDDHGPAEPQRRSVSHAHQVEWEVDAAVVRGADQYAGAARGEGVEADLGRGGEGYGRASKP